MPKCLLVRSQCQCLYWVFERGYKSKKGSLVEFSQLCDMADSSELTSTIDCQYCLFECGHNATLTASNKYGQKGQQRRLNHALVAANLLC